MTTNFKKMIELREIAPYLAYKVEIGYKLDSMSEYAPAAPISENDYFGECFLHQNDLDWIKEFDFYKPILRPLSDLAKPCLEGGKVPIDELRNMGFYFDPDFWLEDDGEINTDNWSYSCVLKLHEWKFWTGKQNRFRKDIIDINKLQK